MLRWSALRFIISCPLAFGVCTGPATAGWLSIKNDTKAAVLLVEVPANAAARRGKPVRLLPGEVYREYHAEAGVKRVRVVDARTPTRVLVEAKVAWPVDDVDVKIRAVGVTAKMEPGPGKNGGAEAVVAAVAKAP